VPAVPPSDLNALPEWPAGTVAILSTAAGTPHAIPVSTVVRAGDRRMLLALGRRRGSLARLREEPRVALTLLAEGDVALTAHARVEVVQDPMDVSDKVVAVALHVERIQDHNQPRFEIEAGVRWKWTDEDAEGADGEIRAALAFLAEQSAAA